MPSTLPSDSSFFPRSDRRRLFGSWWKRQSPARQDRFATLGPVLSVLMFLAAIIAAFWYLRNEEFEREQESVKRDTEIAQQQIRLRLIENQEQLVRMARELATKAIDQDELIGQSVSFVRERPEVVSLTWVGADREFLGLGVDPRQIAALGLTPPPAVVRFWIEGGYDLALVESLGFEVPEGTVQGPREPPSMASITP